ncbi:2-C-methyl-D-erythritol 4-phosphate cytidylyltransferase [Lishizhenia sp.]|uniref:2-C-methyl-D-erythritol 4-phosphate cytidylyltransferase n=1 Tax=Lishizhenia sp. TaxID=2497594 RepID=UPI00299E6059|nr:2-C-methyl-D-erythritol 4-phosphate cytidylyltransferase [Lishizhenia sp.]MDX1446200.1 2-C-methyl-D-erythritol 4-phosphate cytidylyltransferase [Lishizhenia sp.]
MEKTVIITAGGIGKRMGTKLPKQFLLINGKPILWLTLKRFHDYNPDLEIIITLPEEWLEYWENVCVNYDPIPHRVITGGQERYHSIKNALEVASGELIAIHDGVRPFVNDYTLNNCFKMAAEKGSAIPCLPLKESLRQRIDLKSKAVDRSHFLSVQTPQVFQKDLIQKAYTIEYTKDITDDASLLEKLGVEVHTCMGNEENIKITSKSDLLWAEVFNKVNQD